MRLNKMKVEVPILQCFKPCEPPETSRQTPVIGMLLLVQVRICNIGIGGIGGIS